MLTALATTAVLALAREPADDGWIAELLDSGPESFAPLLEDPARFRLQILVTEVRPPGEEPRLVRHGYRVDAEYFYPASAIKLFGALAALEELNALRRAGHPALDEASAIVYHPLFDDEVLERKDPSNAATGAITLAHEIRKLFLVSDNRAYNRCYEFAGQRALNERMWAAGFPSLRASHRLSEFRSVDDNQRTPYIGIETGVEQIVISERDSELDLELDEMPGLLVGSAHIRGEERVDAPMDFRHKQRVSLADLHAASLRLAGLAPPPDGARALELTPAQLVLVTEAMTLLPRESENPTYDPAEYPDDWVKYLLPGIARVVPPERIRIANKVGRAYGFSTENALVRVEGEQRAFAVTAVIYTNANETVNDGEYEYESVADPFFADLGELLARRLLVEAD